MSFAVDIAFAASVMLAALLASGHALIFKREARSAALWVIVIWVLPALGPILYLVLGINRVERRAARLRRRVERYRSLPQHPPGEPGTHLAPLARLVGEVTQRPLLEGNAVEALVDGAQAYPAMLEAIEGARSSVLMASGCARASSGTRDPGPCSSSAGEHAVHVRVGVQGIGLAPVVAAVDLLRAHRKQQLERIVGEEAHLIKVLETRQAEQPIVKARHILFRAPEDDEAARAEARRKAEAARQRIQGGEDFETVATELSEDPGSAARGGDLGWFGEGAMVEPFQEAAFNASVGQIVGPVETQFGVHIILVEDRSEQEVRIADYAQRLRPSTSSMASMEERLEDLKYFAEDNGDFEAEAALTTIGFTDH